MTLASQDQPEEQTPLPDREQDQDWLFEQAKDRLAAANAAIGSTRTFFDKARDVSPAALDTQTSAGASADPELAKAFALIEKRLPQLPESSRQELRRHFDAAYARLSKSPPSDAPARDRSSQSLSRSGWGR